MGAAPAYRCGRATHSPAPAYRRWPSRREQVPRSSPGSGKPAGNASSGDMLPTRRILPMGAQPQARSCVAPAQPPWVCDYRRWVKPGRAACSARLDPLQHPPLHDEGRRAAAGPRPSPPAQPCTGHARVLHRPVVAARKVCSTAGALALMAATVAVFPVRPWRCGCPGTLRRLAGPDRGGLRAVGYSSRPRVTRRAVSPGRPPRAADLPGASSLAAPVRTCRLSRRLQDFAPCPGGATRPSVEAWA